MKINIDLSLKRIFKVYEGINLEFSADASNLLNNAQYSGSYNGGLGNTNLTATPARGLAVGMASSDTFGTLGVGTFDPRQVVMSLRLRF